MNIKEEIKQYGLLFDGSFGTYFTSLHPHITYSCEYANIKEPAWVLEIHERYLASGAKAIKTNTFCSDEEMLQCNPKEVDEILSQGYRLAKQAAGEHAYVFADIGPIVERKDKQPLQEYQRIVDVFLAQGASCFLFETLHSDAGVHEIAAYIKEQCPHSFIMVSFAISADGYTRQGISGRKLYMAAREDEHIDSVGFNCICGPHHLLQYIKTLDIQDTIVSLMPNAGYPTILQNRTFFADTSTYFASEAEAMRGYGVQIIGGCCGTTPLYIEKIHASWSTLGEVKEDGRSNQEPIALAQQQNPLAGKLKKGQKLIAVELDPPSNCDIDKFMNHADCPIARARVDSSLLAAKVKRELGLEVIPHMTCRDRNINATKALLFGLQIEHIHNVLVVTGDPIPHAERNEIKAVFNFNSQILANYIHDLNETLFPSPFLLYGALNINAVNFKAELAKAKQKEACGIQAFMSQPVLTKQALDNLRLAKQELSSYILGGIIPIVSHRNGMYMNNEIAGICVDEQMLALYEGKSREEAEALAVRISQAIVDEMQEIVDGYYIITPFQRISIVKEIVQYIQTKEKL